MSISDKIEEIRKKPEHIRLRYVWFGVAIVMLFVIIIWLFSLQEIFKKTVPQPDNSESFQKQWEKARGNMPSIEEFMKNGSENSAENEIAPQQNQPSGSTTNEIQK